MSSDSREVASSMGRELGVCEVAESTDSSNCPTLGGQVERGDVWAFSTAVIIILAKKNAEDGLNFGNARLNFQNYRTPCDSRGVSVLVTYLVPALATEEIAFANC